MASTSNKFLALLMLSFLAACSVQGLSKDFYAGTCPKVVDIARGVVGTAIQGNPRVGASLLRLCFHDCFVNGCDGGPLLRKDQLGQSEQSTGPNANSLLGMDVIDDIKTALAQPNCDPSKVSCSDIVVIACREAVNLLQGPTWDLEFGRKDTRLSDVKQDSELPGPDSSLSQLIKAFTDPPKSFSIIHLVAFSGAHTIGKGQCRFFQDSLSSDSNVDDGYKTPLLANCASGGPNSLAPLDYQTENTFDTKYYDDVANKKGLFHSDRELYDSSDSQVSPQDLSAIKDKVDQYRNDPSQESFFNDFKSAMEKLNKLPTPFGDIGEIRAKCSEINPIIPGISVP